MPLLSNVTVSAFQVLRKGNPLLQPSESHHISEFRLFKGSEKEEACAKEEVENKVNAEQSTNGFNVNKFVSRIGMMSTTN